MAEPIPDPGETARIDAVAGALGHQMRDATLLTRACTHASRLGGQSSARERLEHGNERMEFLGDALLGAALCLALYRRAPDANEGTLSRRKSVLVSRATLARLIEEHGLLAHCLVGAQMAHPWPDSVKANLMESILAAVHLDGGFEALCGAVEKLYGERLATDGGQAADDAKTALQEYCLGRWSRLPAYECVRSGGSDHAPVFTAVVRINDTSASGEGSSRRRAEVAAAEALHAKLREAEAAEG